MRYIDGKIKEHQIADTFGELKSRSNSPNVLRLQRRFLPDQLSLVPRDSSSGCIAECVHVRPPLSLERNKHAVRFGVRPNGVRFWNGRPYSAAMPPRGSRLIAISGHSRAHLADPAPDRLGVRMVVFGRTVRLANRRRAAVSDAGRPLGLRPPPAVLAARLRSWGKRSLLRRRMDRGVTSTNSSSSI